MSSSQKILSLISNYLGVGATLGCTIPDLGGDELDIVEIIIDIEDEFSIELDFDNDAVFDTLTVGDLIFAVDYMLENTISRVDEALLKKILSTKKKVLMASLDPNDPSLTKATGNSPVNTPVNHRKRWTPADVLSLVIQYGKGISIKIIAESLGRTEVSILDRLEQLGMVKFNRSEKAYYTVPSKIYQFK